MYIAVQNFILSETFSEGEDLYIVLTENQILNCRKRENI